MNNLIKTNKAFTLIEIMVVIGIIAILSAIAIPYFRTSEDKLKAAATGLMSDIQKTRSTAIKTNKTWGIWFDKAGNRYIISSDAGNDDAWSKIDADDSQPIEKEVVFSDYTAGVQYGHGAATETVTGSKSFPKEETTYSSEVLTFDSKGVCSGAVKGYGYRYVYLEYGDSTYAVGTGATGIVRLFRWNGKKWE